jgi:hypothetical protein
MTRFSRPSARMPSLVAGLALILALVPESTQTVEAATGVVYNDPVGDTSFNAPAYTDIVSCEAVRSGQTLTFAMTLAAPIPTRADLPQPANTQVEYVWGLDTNPATTPAGYPLAPGYWVYVEYGLQVVWDGTTLTGNLIDRTPLLAGADAVITPQPFTVSGPRISTSVRVGQIGNPGAFNFDCGTTLWSGPFGTNGRHTSDGLDPMFNPGPA